MFELVAHLRILKFALSNGFDARNLYSASIALDTLASFMAMSCSGLLSLIGIFLGVASDLSYRRDPSAVFLFSFSRIASSAHRDIGRLGNSSS